MGFWDDVGDFLGDAVDTAAGVVETVANAVGEYVSDWAESVGNAVEDGLNAVGDALGEIPGVGGVLKAWLGWVGGVISSALDVVGAAAKGTTAIVGGVIGGVIRVVGGALSGNGSLVVKGLVGMAASVGGAVVVGVGKIVAFVQTVIPIQARERPLTEAEAAMLKRVFHESVALYNVRLVEGRSGLYDLNPRPFTLGNTIYLKKRSVANEPQLLVHEVVHVWQYQNNGARYAGDALGAQWLVEDRYSWKAEVARGNTRWPEFNAEAQGSFFEHLFKIGELLRLGTARKGGGAFFDAGPPGTTGRFVFDGADHTDRANDAVEVVRGRTALRLSNLWS